MVYRRCAIRDCENKDASRHRFPNPDKSPELFNAWVQACQNTELNSLDPNFIFRSYKICHIHFRFEDRASNMYLRKDAVPLLHLSPKMTDTCTQQAIIKEEPEDDPLMNIIKSESDNNLQPWTETSRIIEFNEKCDNSDDEKLNLEINECTNKNKTTNNVDDDKSQIASEINLPKKEVNEDLIFDEIKIEIETPVLPDLVDIDSIDDKSSAGCIKTEDETTDIQPKKNKRTRSKRQHNCAQCNYITNRKDALNRHMNIHNKEEVEKHYCDHCNYITIHKHCLERHKIIHNTMKPLQCKFCEKYFIQKNGLKIHMNVHHPDLCQDKMKVLQCDKCTFNTVDSRAFSRHKFKHADIENLTKHICPTCDYSTYCQSNFKKHLAIHTGNKPFACEFCEYCAVRRSCVKMHTRRCHKNML